MKASKLRIGNYIEFDNEIVKTSTLAEFYVYVRSLDEEALIDAGLYKNLKPIPLTEEWLLKFGFKKHHGDYYNETLAVWEKGYLWYYSIYPRKEMWDELPSMSAHRTGHYLKTVNQLQNLYHVLTGKELTIKE